MKLKLIFLMTLMAMSLALMSGSVSAQVYKTVDEDGNVTYTDRPPKDGSKPMELPELSVIEAPTYQKTAREAAAEDPATAEDAETPLKTLRRNYRDFAIISPLNEESVWHPEQAVPVAWSVSNPLEAGMTVTLFVDGKRLAATTQPIVPVAGLERGEHILTAELRDRKNRRIASAQPITFFIKRPSIFTNRVRPGG